MNISTLHPEFGDLRFSDTIEDRFWKCVVTVPYDRGCWIWTAHTNDKGYGHIGRGAKGAGQIKAHVLSWILHNGRIPEGKCVLHRCDNPPCVNPNHLWLGTKGDNNRDAASKGRNHHGETHRFAKLTNLDILNIRSLWPEVSQSELARRYGVNWSAIWKIVHRKNWAHIA